MTLLGTFVNNFLCGHVFTPLGYTGNVQKMRAGRLTPGVGGVQRPPSHLLTHPPSPAPRSLRHRLTTREAGLEGWRTWLQLGRWSCILSRPCVLEALELGTGLEQGLSQVSSSPLQTALLTPYSSPTGCFLRLVEPSPFPASRQNQCLQEGPRCEYPAHVRPG